MASLRHSKTPESGDGDDDTAVEEVQSERGRPHVRFLEQLYKANFNRLLLSVTRKVSSRDEALDVVQEAFARLTRLSDANLTKLEKPDSYLSRVATNLLRDRARVAERRREDVHVSIDDAVIMGPDTERLLEARDTLRRLELAMLKLKPRTREIFMAHRLDGMSYAEIAERTGMTVKGVEKQMSKAIAQIDRLLGRP